MISLPTKITFIRIILTPIIIFLILIYHEKIQEFGLKSSHTYWILTLFSIAIISDIVDGYLSRKFNLITRLGSFLDPIADKILIISTTLVLTYVDCGNPLPIYYTTLIVARESIQISGAISIGIISGDITIKHHWTGKIATFLQILMVYCSLTLESVSFCFSLSLLTSFFAIWSAIMYIHNGLIQLPSTHDASSNK
ncbi:MAG: CDP-alcohol phosphatidyltransferase family protein [Verrucomicrobiota bacterium]|nr:CDP-alcohol phosphatidyltransferase family protein [Verrucomicrobiota bacterium]